MALTYDEIKGISAGRPRISYPWAASIQAACDTLSRMPADLMDSISVTGRLEGRSNEINLVAELCRELAGRNGLQVSIDSGSDRFAARFSRKPAD